MSEGTLYGLMTPLIFHWGAVNGLSMISGRYRRNGWPAVRPLFFLPQHLAGLALMGLAMLCFVLGASNGAGWLFVAGGAFMVADVGCIFSAVRRAS